jgi:hypothetical protein
VTKATVKKLLSRLFLLLPFIFVTYVAAASLFEPTLDTPFKNAPRPIIRALRAPLEDLPQIENFEVVGYNQLPKPGDTIARGRNWPIALSGNCLYVGNRIGRRTGTTGLPPEVLIVDISRSHDPQVVSAFATVPGATSREMRAIPVSSLARDNYADSHCSQPELLRRSRGRNPGRLRQCSP